MAKYEFNRIAFYICTPLLQHIYMMTLPFNTLVWRSVMSVVICHLWTRFRDGGGGGGWKMRRFSLVYIDVLHAIFYIYNKESLAYNMQISSWSA